MSHRMTYTYCLTVHVRGFVLVQAFFESQTVLFVWFFLSSISYFYTVFQIFFSTRSLARSLAESKIIANCEFLVSGDTLLTTVVKISCSLGRTLVVSVSPFLRLCKQLLLIFFGVFTCLLRSNFRNIFRAVRHLNKTKQVSRDNIYVSVL